MVYVQRESDPESCVSCDGFVTPCVLLCHSRLSLDFDFRRTLSIRSVRLSVRWPTRASDAVCAGRYEAYEPMYEAYLSRQMLATVCYSSTYTDDIEFVHVSSQQRGRVVIAKQCSSAKGYES